MRMLSFSRIRVLMLGTSTAAIALAGVAAGLAPAQAAPAGAARHTVYVAPRGTATARDAGCGSAAYRSVDAAVAAAPSGGTVVVCGGSYDESVAITRPLSLVGLARPLIDAAGNINGVVITAPDVTVRGFRVTSATAEGILVDGANHVTLTGNTVAGNDLGAALTDPVPTAYAECQSAGGVPGDCGEGIHLMGSSYSLVSGNTSTGNSGGILVSDETGPAAHDQITGNVVTGNVSDCGITVVGHNPAAAPGGVPAPAVAGVFGNRIAGNLIAGNGTSGEGAGVVLATALPGGAVYDNTVTGNSISGNGLSGVTVHSHVTGQYMNGNVVVANRIGTNNVTGDNDFAPDVDDQTTGVLVATVDPLAITVSGNVISDNQFGIWTTGPATVAGARANAFRDVTEPVAAG